MKKITLAVLAALTMSSSAFAQVTTTYVDQSKKNDILAAIQAPIGAGKTHVVVLCKSLTATGEEAEVADGSAQTAATNLGGGTNTGMDDSGENKKPWTKANAIGGPIAPAAGTLIIRSNQTNKELLPKLQMDMVFQRVDKAVGLPSVVFENLYIQAKSNAGYPLSMKTTSTDWTDTEENNIIDEFYDIDSVVYRNCVIAEGRSIFRQENNASNPTPHHIKNFVFENNLCYENNPNTNPFPRFYFVSVPANLTMTNNLFYDMPYAKSLIAFHKSVRTDGEAATFNIYNNTFMLSGYSTDGTATQNFKLIDASLAGQTLFDASSTMNIYNNMFLGAEEGVKKPAAPYTLLEDNAITLSLNDEAGNPIGYLTTKNNYYSKYWSAPTRTGADDLDLYEDLDAANYPFTFSLFNKPAKNNFTIEKANSAGLFTAGAAAIEDFDGKPLFEIPTCVGAPQMYVDEFPVEAEINVTVNSEVSGYDTYTVNPQKNAYEAGDEVTITLDAAKLQNSLLKPVDITWSDGQAAGEASRTVTLTASGVNLTATVAPKSDIIAAFPFVGANGTVSTFNADVNAGSEVAKVSMYAPIDGSYQLVTDDNKSGNYFQARSGKFGEDDADKQINIISRRTNGDVRTAVGPVYAQFEFSTKGFSDVKFSAFVGTDNLAVNKQVAEYSLDGTTWTELASVNLADNKRAADFGGNAGELYGWSEIAGTLPAAYSDQDKVYVRVIGKADDLSSADAYVFNSVNGTPDYTTATTFEYVGAVSVTGTATTGVAGVRAADEAAAAPVKAVENGRVVITKDGKKFTAAGAQVK